MTTTFGIELEVTRVSTGTAARALNAGGITCTDPGYTHQVTDTWKSVPDGSVRGAEVVSPILTEDRLNEVTRVCNALKAAGASVNSTTGLHIHIGARHLTPEQIGTFTRNWYAVHHATGALVSKSRLNNRFCRVLDRYGAEAVARAGGCSDRYQSLNLAALTKYGTLEVRLHQGSLNAVKILAWAQYLEALLKVAEAGIELSTETPDGLRVWDRPGTRDADQARILLQWLETNGYLKPNASNWLQVRAGLLNA